VLTQFNIGELLRRCVVQRVKVRFCLGLHDISIFMTFSSIAVSIFILRKRYVQPAITWGVAMSYYSLMQTTTSLWKAEDAIGSRASVDMPTHH
jgi:hypothetical protein